jgi:hypothetical protein
LFFEISFKHFKRQRREKVLLHSSVPVQTVEKSPSMKPAVWKKHIPLPSAKEVASPALIRNAIWR